MKYFLNTLLIVFFTTPLLANQSTEKSSPFSNTKSFLYGTVTGMGLCAAILLVRAKTKQYQALRADFNTFKNNFTNKKSWSWPWNRQTTKLNESLINLQKELSTYNKELESVNSRISDIHDMMKSHGDDLTLLKATTAQTRGTVEKINENVDRIDSNLLYISKAIAVYFKEQERQNHSGMQRFGVTRWFTNIIRTQKEIPKTKELS